METIHNKNRHFKCEKCEQFFTNEKKLETHIINNHVGVNCLQPECMKWFKHKDALRKHRHKVHSVKLLHLVKWKVHLFSTKQKIMISKKDL